MPAEVGHGAAGFTDIVTKSGTNRFTAACSSLCETPLSMRAITSTDIDPTDGAVSRRSRATNLDSPTAVRS